MLVKAGQIYFVKNAKLGKANYARPCLVLRVNATSAHVTYFSTKIELCRSIDLIIYDSDPGFTESGLQETSCLIADRDISVDLSVFKHAKFMGQLAHVVKNRIENWWGEAMG